MNRKTTLDKLHDYIIRTISRLESMSSFLVPHPYIIKVRFAVQSENVTYCTPTFILYPITSELRKSCQSQKKMHLTTPHERTKSISFRSTKARTAHRSAAARAHRCVVDFRFANSSVERGEPTHWSSVKWSRRLFFTDSFAVCFNISNGKSFVIYVDRYIFEN